MSSWLFEGALSIALFVVLIPVLVAPFLAVVYRAYRYPAPGPTLLAAATGLYVCSLVAFTTFPLPEAPEEFCSDRGSTDYWQLTPGASLGDVLDRTDEVGLTAALTSGVTLQIIFNVVFFIPLGFLVAYRLHRGPGAALLAGLGTSLLIEFTQGTALWGIYPCPYRLADVDDLLTNTAGALLGWGIGSLVSRRWPFREPPPRVDLAAPTLRRRLLAAGLDLVVLLVVTLGVDVVIAFVGSSRGSDVESVRPVFELVQYAVGVLLLLMVPLVRRDRATPGQLTVLLGLSQDSTGEPAHAPSVFVRFAVRWLPVLVFGLVGLLIVAIAELATVLIRSDRRSLSGLLGRTRTITHDSLTGDGLTAADVRSS
jgi:glycopeptide antibiotics resistance protein